VKRGAGKMTTGEGKVESKSESQAAIRETETVSDEHSSVSTRLIDAGE